MKKIKNFTETEHRFLSNFYPCVISFSTVTYPSVEHAFQAEKTLDMDIRRKIAKAPTPGKAKSMGRKVKLRPDWECIKDAVMLIFLHQKFAIPKFRRALLATGDVEIIEGNNHGDCYWGVYKGVGQNKLGKLLMQVRQDIKNEKKVK